MASITQPVVVMSEKSGPVAIPLPVYTPPPLPVPIEGPLPASYAPPIPPVIAVPGPGLPPVVPVIPALIAPPVSTVPPPPLPVMIPAAVPVSPPPPPPPPPPAAAVVPVMVPTAPPQVTTYPMPVLNSAVEPFLMPLQTNPFEQMADRQLCLIDETNPGLVSCLHYDTTAGPETLNPDWMSFLPDDLLLSDVSMPGTHNSLSRYGGPAAQCQAWTVDTQLKAGIRYLDLRVRIDLMGELGIYHGAHYQQITVGDVFLWTAHFLEQHQREVVLIRIRLDREKDPRRICKDKTKPKELARFERDLTIAELADEDQRLYQGILHLIGQGDTLASFAYSVSDPNITLGMARGKFIIVQDFEGPMAALQYDTFDIADPYCLESLDQSAVQQRQKILTSHIKKAGVSKSGKIYLTYTSAGWSVYPFQAASHINAGVLNYLEKHPDKTSRKTGIIAMDFPGKHIISVIIHQNFMVTRKWSKTRYRFVVK